MKDQVQSNTYHPYVTLYDKQNDAFKNSNIEGTQKLLDEEKTKKINFKANKLSYSYMKTALIKTPLLHLQDILFFQMYPK